VLNRFQVKDFDDVFECTLGTHSVIAYSKEKGSGRWFLTTNFMYRMNWNIFKVLTATIACVCCYMYHVVPHVYDLF
jgi:hypothetical protein